MENQGDLKRAEGTCDPALELQNRYDCSVQRLEIVGK